MPLSRKILPHGKAKVQAGIATGSSVTGLNLNGTTLELNQDNNQPQRTVSLADIAGDITGVTAGDGLTGGGNTGAVTLAVGVGTGLDVSADAVTLDLTEVGFGGGANRLITDDGDGTVTTEANLTFDGSTLAVTGNLTVSGDITGSDDVVINDDLVVKDNISLDSDSAVLLFGDDGEVNLTHVHDAGLILNSTNYLAFGSSANRIFANSGVLSLYGNSEVELNATNIDINGAVDISGNTNIGGNLTVQGTTTTIDSTTLSVKDKNIEMGVVSSPTDVTADGGGITLKGTTDKTFNWIDSTDSWTASEHIELASGKSFRINGNNVLNQTTLGSTVVSSSLTSVGTLTSATISGDLTVDTDTLKVDSSNDRVGINNSSPDKTFVIRTGGTRDFKFFDYDLTYESSLGIRAKNNGYLALVTEGNNEVFISTNGFANKRVRVTSGGDVTLGGEAATVNGARLHVNASDTNLVANFFSTDGIGEIRVGDNYSTGSHKYTRILSVGSQLKLMPDNGAEMMNLDGSAYRTTLLGESGGNSPKLTFDNPDASNDIQLTQGDAGWFGLSTDGGSTQHFIARTGNIGIGVESPSQKLDVVGNIELGTNSYTTISDNEYDVSSGDLLFDVAGDITLDAGGSDIKLSKAGGNKASFYLTASDVYFGPKASDGDFIITGSDGGSQITALTFDMSEAGNATFNQNVTVPSNLLLGSNLVHNGDTDTYLGFETDTIKFFANNAEQLAITDNVITLGDGVVLAPHASDNFTIDSPNGIILDGTSASNGVQYHDGGAEILRISNTNSNPVIRTMTDGLDMIFQQYDGTEVMRVTDSKLLKVGGSSATGNHIFVERDSTDETYDFIHGKAKYPRIRFEDTQANASMYIWHLGNQMRFGTNAGSSTTAAMVIQNGQPSSGLGYAKVLLNSGVVIGSSDPINSARTTIIDTTRPLLLGYDGSNYVNFEVGSSGQLTIDAGNDINLDANSGLFNFKDGGTEFFRIGEDGSSNTFLQTKVDAKDIVFKQYDGNEVMRITDNQRVGIGTAAPSAPLHVDTTSTSYASIFQNDSTNGYVMKLVASDSSLLFQTDHIIPSLNMHLGNDNVNFYMRTAGYKFGVGTSSPKTSMSLVGALSIEERADHETTNAGWGQLWVKNDSPNKLIFTDDAGTDHDLTASGGSPGGSNTQLQYNNGGSFGGMDDWTWDGTDLSVAGSSKLKFGASLRHIVQSGDNLLIRNSENNGNIELNAKNDMKFFIDGVQKMHIDSNGNVGIGTTSPSKSFQVAGTAKVDGEFFAAGGGDFTAGSFRFRDGVLQAFGTDRDVAWTFDNTNDRLLLVSGNSVSNTTLMHIGADPTDGMYVAGKVGIGTTSPSSELSVAGTLDVSANVDVGNRVRYKSGTTKYLDFTADSATSISMSGFQAFRPAVSGNAAGNGQDIGTAAFPWHNMYLETSLFFGGASNLISSFDTDNLYLRAHNDMYFNIDTPNDSTSRHFIFRANTSTEIMRLGEDLIAEFKGNVGIGTAAPAVALDVRGSGWPMAALHASSQYGTGLQLYNSHTTQQDWAIIGGGATYNYAFRVYDQTDATYRFAIDRDGKVGIGGTNAEIVAPDTALHIRSSTASEPVVTIENSNADNNPPGLTFFKNTASPASSDQVGSIKFDSKEATSGDTKTYWEIQSRINDATNTTPNGQLNFYGLDGDSPGFIHQFQFINSQFSVLNSDGVGPTIAPTGTNGGMFKTAGSKMRLQAKSDSTGEIHMMAHNVGINTTSPGARLHIVGGTSYNNTEGIRLGTTSTYASMYMNNSSGGLEIDSPHSMVLDANRHMEFHAGGTTREHRYMYATTQYGFMTTADSNSYWAIGNKSIASNGLLLSGAAGGIRMVPANSTVTVKGNVDMENNGAVLFDNTNNNNQTFIRNGGTNAASLQFGVGTPSNSNTKIHLADDGKVGIGTTSPNSKMTVSGDLDIPRGSRFRAGSTDSNQGIDIYHNNDGSSTFNGNVVLEGRSSGGDVVFRNLDHGQGYQFHAENSSGTEQLIMYMDGANKRVGIGTSTPNSELDVFGDIRITNKNGSNPTDAGSLIFEEAGDNWGSSLFGFRINLEGSSNYLNFQSANQSTIKDVLTLTRDTAYVGINTTSPSNLLHLKGGKIEIEKSDSSKHLLIDENSIRTTTTNDLSIFTNGNSDQLVLDQGGNVGIGTNAPGETLHVAGTGRFTSNLAVGTTTQPTSTGLSVSTTIQVAERSSAPSHVESSGILWVKNDDPTNLYFTDDDGNDIALTNNGSAAGGGSTSPGGSDTQVQFNNGGAFAGSSNMTFNGTTLSIGGLAVNGTSTFSDHITIAENKELRFDSSDSFIKADTDNPEDLEIHADDDIFLNADDDVFIQNDGNTYVSFDGANRRVGIGETSPDDLLHLKGSSNVDIRLEDSDATGMGNMDTMIRGFRQSTEAWFLGTESGAGTLKLGITSGHTSDLALHTAGSERLRVTDAGKVGIGTTAPDTLLHVAGALTSSPTKMITSMTTEGNPGTTRTVNVTEDIFQYIGQVVDGGIVAFELPSSPDIGETYRIVWETRNAFGIGPINSVVKLTRAASSIQINGSTSDFTLKSNSSTNTFRGIAEVVCIDDGTGLAGAVAYVVQNTEV